MDCAAAAENVLAAESLGIGSCWIYFSSMAFSDTDGDKLKTELEIPKGYRPVISMALGYQSGPKAAPPSRSEERIAISISFNNNYRVCTSAFAGIQTLFCYLLGHAFPLFISFWRLLSLRRYLWLLCHPYP